MAKPYANAEKNATDKGIVQIPNSFLWNILVDDVDSLKKKEREMKKLQSFSLLCR